MHHAHPPSESRLTIYDGTSGAHHHLADSSNHDIYRLRPRALTEPPFSCFLLDVFCGSDILCVSQSHIAALCVCFDAPSASNCFWPHIFCFRCPNTATRGSSARLVLRSALCLNDDYDNDRPIGGRRPLALASVMSKACECRGLARTSTKYSAFESGFELRRFDSATRT